MIIVDTNVVSEPLKRVANPAVQRWLDRQPSGSLFFTATALSEILLGIALMPDGRRKQGLHAAGIIAIAKLFGPRIFAFDRMAAEQYAKVVYISRAAGRPVSMGDAQIAAIALVHGCAVATRDVQPFALAGVDVINPWLA